MTLADALAAGVLVADGAMGTLGHARGLEGLPALWTLTHPDAVEAIHREYVGAGARLVTTNTFCASRAWLPRDVDVEAINGAAVALARRAAADRAIVAGDVGPARLRPFDEARAIFREQIAALARAGVDAIFVETMSSLDELRAAAVAAADVRADVPVIASMTFEPGERTHTGATPAALVALADELGLAAVGANCSDGPASIVPVVAALAALTNRPIVAKPSAGVARYLGAAEMAVAARRLVDVGARVVGGCCGTTPDTIRAIAGILA